MDIVINHLTRIAPGRISAAGICLPDQQIHIRPCPPSDLSFTREMMVEKGGPFSVGALINIAETQWHPRRPHVEDHIVESQALRQCGRMDPRMFWQVLDYNAKDDLESIFGPELRASGSKFNWRVVDADNGLASLGLLRLRCNAILTVDNGIKVWLNDSGARACLRVTDHRLHYDDGAIRYDLACAIAERLDEGETCIMSVGLTRAFAPSGDRMVHLAQVNNIYFEADPLGDKWFSH
jgi:hypothetical protein